MRPDNLQFVSYLATSRSEVARRKADESTAPPCRPRRREDPYNRGADGA